MLVLSCYSYFGGGVGEIILIINLNTYLPFFSSSLTCIFFLKVRPHVYPFHKEQHHFLSSLGAAPLFNFSWDSSCSTCVSTLKFCSALSFQCSRLVNRHDSFWDQPQTESRMKTWWLDIQNICTVYCVCYKYTIVYQCYWVRKIG